MKKLSNSGVSSTSKIQKIQGIQTLETQLIVPKKKKENNHMSQEKLSLQQEHLKRKPRSQELKQTKNFLASYSLLMQSKGPRTPKESKANKKYTEKSLQTSNNLLKYTIITYFCFFYFFWVGKDRIRS